MASTYHKGKSDVIWIRYKTAQGKWKGKPTGYHWSNKGEVRQAELLARRQTEIEASRKTTTSESFAEWVLNWIITTYGESSTADYYKRIWIVLERFLLQEKIETPSQITRSLIPKYLEWRMKKAARNTAINEIKILSMILNEAVKRGYILKNPLAKAGLRRGKTKPKKIWSNEVIQIAAKRIQKCKALLPRAMFFFGLYQACRRNQCGIPLTSIRLDLNVIQYPPEFVKGRSGYSQPIDPRFRPILERMMKEAKALGMKTICDVPWDASIRFRKILDSVGLREYVHHGLRYTWITRAAERGVIEAHAMAFCHHESAEVHRIYKQLSVIGITHVPALLDFPELDLQPAGSKAISENVLPSSSSKIRKRSRLS